MNSVRPDQVLLTTKLHPPRLRPGAIRRPRLTGRSARDLPVLTLVSAPAGFGKTTLLAEWIASNEDRPVAWLSLDGGDNDLTVFWTYVVAAVRAAAPDAGSDALSLLNASQPSTSVATSLLNDLAELDDDLVVVFDDYHVIETPDVHDALSFLVDHAPPRLHLVVAGRADPPLPLARLRATGNLLELRAAELRFTAEETTRYFDASAGLQLTPTDIAALESRTEGWIAALQLAALSMQGRDDPAAFIADFAGDDRFVVDYLAEEVLERLPHDVREFLLHTSILDRFTGGLCDAVTGSRGSKEMLERLDRANLFLVALDDRRLWYRYHHLFADVLRARLLDGDAGLILTLHRRASAWHEAHDDRAEAITHAMAGRDFDSAARLIELAAPVLRQLRQEHTLRRWLEALPDDIFDNRPVLAIDLVGARMATGDATGVAALLDLVEASLQSSAAERVIFDEHDYAGLPAQALVYRAGLGLLAGDLDATIRHASAALELVEPDDHLRRGSASALLALAHWTAGDLATAEHLYSEAVVALTAAGYLADMLGCSLALGDIQIAQGRLTDAARTFGAGLGMTAANPGLRGAADMHVGLSEVLIERDDLDTAANHLRASAELGEAAGLPQHAYRWRVTAARLRRARGDLDGALALIEEAEPLYATDFSPPVRPVAAMQARVRLANGELDAALDWVAQRGLEVDDELSYVREYEHITLARVLLARHALNGDRIALEHAHDLLARLLIAAREGSRHGSEIEILILQAAAHQAGNDTPAALAALGEALTRSEPECHVRLFLHVGPGITSLLRSFASGENASAHAKRVLGATVPAVAARPAAPRRGPLVDDLSARELDVLRLLRSDLSGPDIARELVVSLNTVRTHTKNIYSKLGVSNRRAAITRAAELGL